MKVDEQGFNDTDITQDPFLLMYHGVVAHGRGIEKSIEALTLLPSNFCLVVLGDGTQNYLRSLKQQCRACGLENRVLFHPAIAREELEAWVAAADVGLVTIEAVSQSYYYMLPNKFFENIQAETPVIASNYPETERLVKEYGIGLTCDPSDPTQIAECAKRLRDDTVLYQQCKRGLARAKRELCWEHERVILLKEYGKIVGHEASKATS